ncbi:MAG: cobaltochelatase subunit CobN, partial [Pseudomonadota bacterium]
MHLLQLQSGGIDDGSEAVDLGQDPADILILSAADTELSLLAQAASGTLASENEHAGSVRLANLLHLAHPMSVDQWIDKTAQHSRLIIARLLGGRNYWPYGVEELATLAKQRGLMLALLPGDDKPDADLQAASTVPPETFQRLHHYLSHGGRTNAHRLLQLAQHLVAPEKVDAPPEAAPLLRAGLYWPGLDTPSADDLKKSWLPDAPCAGIIFYRALMQSGATQAIGALIQGLRQEGLNPLPLFVSSLKDPESVAVLEHLTQTFPPNLILNTTGFTVAGFHQQGAVSFDGTGVQDPLSRLKCPVVQIVLSSGTREDWEGGMRGLSARDIAMNVALPEVDGRIIGPTISFKDDRQWDERTQCWIVKPTAVEERATAAARLARNWCALARKTPAERRVALILANYPNKDSRLANGVGLDTPAAAVTVIKALSERGYSVANPPQSSGALMQSLLSMPTNDLAARAERSGGVTLSLPDYKRAYADLPESTRRGIEERWGQPEADPFFEGAHGSFRLGIIEMGNVIVGVQPARGYNIDPKETYHSPDLP